MIPYNEIFESLPFALACCNVADPKNINIQSIQIEYSNTKFKKLISMHSKTVDQGSTIQNNFYNEENFGQILKLVKQSLLYQKQEEVVYFSMDLKDESTLIISPVDQTRFVILFIEDYKGDINTKQTKQQLEATSLRLNQMAEFGRIFVWEINENGVYNYVSPVVTSILGYTPEELLGMTVFDLFPEHGKEEIKKKVSEVLASQEAVINFENPIVRKDGETIWMMTNGFPVYKENGDFKGYRGYDQDITKMMDSQKALEESEEKYRLLTESVSDILWIYNYNQLNFTYFSPSIKNLTGYSAEQFLDKRVSEIMTEESYKHLKKTLEESIEAFVDNPQLTHRELLDIELTTIDDKTVWTEVSFSFRYTENDEVEVVGVGRDVSDRKLAQQQLQYITFHDSLTGLYNRAFYEEELSRLFVKRNLPLSLILADINDLKLVNDAFGHLEGDKLIQEFARILQESCREDDIVARIGGDEFVLLLPQTNEEETKNIMRRITQATEKSTATKILLSVAMGSMTTYKETVEFDTLFVEAEDAMYKHKLRNKDDQTRDVVAIIENSFKVKHPRYYQLCKSTSEYAIALAKALELSENEISDVTNGSLFALIGTLKDPSISIKDQPTHVVENGYHLLKQVPNFRDVADIVLSIYEQVNGKGTPHGLSSDAIPLASKIIRIALDFCTILQETPLTSDKVIELLQLNVGVLYDEQLFTHFRLIEEEKAKNETVRS